MQWVSKFPSLYGFLFRKTRDDTTLSILFKKIRTFGLSRMMKLIDDVKPTVIVSTFPSAAAAMSVLKVNGLTDIPTVTVITDHTDHSYWIHPGTDRYIVGSEHVRRALKRWPISELKISVTGIPIRTPFTLSYDRDILRARHGLDPSLPAVLVMGGGYGLIGKEFIELLQSDRLSAPMQFIIICGHNAKLKEQLAEELKGSPHRILLTGYVDYIHELMAAADLLITKPGGLTTAEALSQELPMILYRPLPGQEMDNAAYLTHAGVALQALSEEDLAAKLVQVFQNPHILHKIKGKARQYQSKAAAALAVHEILDTESGSVPGRGIRHAVYAEA